MFHPGASTPPSEGHGGNDRSATTSATIEAKQREAASEERPELNHQSLTPSRIPSRLPVSADDDVEELHAVALLQLSTFHRNSKGRKSVDPSSVPSLVESRVDASSALEKDEGALPAKDQNSVSLQEEDATKESSDGSCNRSEDRDRMPNPVPRSGGPPALLIGAGEENMQADGVGSSVSSDGTLCRGVIAVEATGIFDARAEAESGSGIEAMEVDEEQSRSTG